MNKEIESQDELETGMELTKQDNSTVKILQDDDLKSLSEAMEKARVFKKKYTLKRLTVSDIDDKQKREELRLAIGDIRGVKVALDKDRKEKTLPYRDTISYINTNYDKAIISFENLLDPLKNHQKQINDAIEEREQKEENDKKELLASRIATLIKAGVSFDGEWYSVGSPSLDIEEISLGVADIQSMTENIFETQLKIINDKVELIKVKEIEVKAKTERIEKERKEKEQKDKELLELGQKKLREEKEELDKERAEFAEMKEEMRIEKEKVEDEKSAEFNRKAMAEFNILSEIRDERREQLSNLGFISDRNHNYNFYDFTVTNEDIESDLPSKEWDSLMEKVTKLVEIKKGEIQLKFIKDTDSANKIIADKAILDKENADKELKRLAQEKLLDSKDAYKWSAFMQQVESITHAPFVSKKYTKLISLAMSKLDEIKELK